MIQKIYMKSEPEKNLNISLKFFKKFLGSCTGLSVIIVFYPENRKNSNTLLLFSLLHRQ